MRRDLKRRKGAVELRTCVARLRVRCVRVFWPVRNSSKGVLLWSAVAPNERLLLFYLELKKVC